MWKTVMEELRMGHLSGCPVCPACHSLVPSRFRPSYMQYLTVKRSSKRTAIIRVAVMGSRRRRQQRTGRREPYIQDGPPHLPPHGALGSLGGVSKVHHECLASKTLATRWANRTILRGHPKESPTSSLRALRWLATQIPHLFGTRTTLPGLC
jgi:hypothetical protein